MDLHTQWSRRESMAARTKQAGAATVGVPADAGWLDLLLSGADINALEETRARLLAAAGTTERRAEIEQAAGMAIRIHAQLREHRKRVVELGALHDLTVRLSGVRNVDALLEDIVMEARRLLDVDVAYLAMREPDDSLHIRVANGSLSPHLRGVVIPPHAGLAGRVVDTGSPVSSTDYLADPDLQHVEDVDKIARLEELRTIAGVPMRLRTDIIGVLMIGERDVRPPTANELSLLGSLASFAALAIESAHQLDEQRRAHDALRVQSEGTSRAATLHERLMDVAVSGGGVEKIIEALSDVVDGVIAFADEADRVVAAAQAGDPAEGVAVALVQGAQPSVWFRPLSQRHPVVDGGVTTVPVASVDSYFGALQVTEAAGGLDDITRRLLERSALTIALVVASERAVSDAERRTSSEILEQLLTRRIDDLPGFTRRARSLGLDLSAGHAVAVVDPGTRGPQLLADLERHVHTKGGLAARLGGQLVAVVPVADLDEARNALRTVAAKATVGVAGPATGPAALKQSYDDAAACASVLTALGRDGECAGPDDLGPYRFLLARSGRDDVGRFVERTIGPLVRHDEVRGTHLVETADVFLATGRQHAAAATELCIHPNTLYQRLQRISRLLGEGWRAGDRALDTQLALRLNRLLSEGPHTS